MFVFFFKFSLVFILTYRDIILFLKYRKDETTNVEILYKGILNNLF